MKKLDIFVPPPFSSIGGPSTFLKNLHTTTNDQGYSFNSKLNNIFFPISYDIRELEKIKQKGGKIVQRLDGIYYPSKHGPEYAELNKWIKEIYQNYATHIIFQSEYSKQQCFELFGPINNFDVIHNGTNKKIFNKTNCVEASGKTIFITTGNFRNLDMLEPVILALDELEKKYDFELRVLGPISLNTLKPYLERSYCNYLGESADQNVVASNLKNSDAFIFSHLNPPCPNSVVEAISCGLPVISFDSGAMKELCFFNKSLLAPVESDETFQRYESFKYSNLANKIEMYLNNQHEHKEIAMNHSYLYSMEECMLKYLRVFQNLGVKEKK